MFWFEPQISIFDVWLLFVETTGGGAFLQTFGGRAQLEELITMDRDASQRRPGILQTWWTLPVGVQKTGMLIETWRLQRGIKPLLGMGLETILIRI